MGLLPAARSAPEGRPPDQCRGIGDLSPNADYCLGFAYAGIGSADFEPDMEGPASLVPDVLPGQSHGGTGLSAGGA